MVTAKIKKLFCHCASWPAI